MVSSGIWKASTDSDKGNYLANGVDLSVVIHPWSDNSYDKVLSNQTLTVVCNYEELDKIAEFTTGHSHQNRGLSTVSCSSMVE
jgi:hypothetical protein